MLLCRICMLTVVIPIITCAGPCGLAAEESGSLPNVLAAFEAVSDEGSSLTIQCDDLRMPPGGHIQGIQLKYDATRNRYLGFLSHDSRRFGYVVVVAFDADLKSAGEVLNVHRFAEIGLRHAGGIQLCGDILVVGLEDNQAKDQSEIQFWDVADPLQWQPLSHLTISRSGAPKDQTAGAVGMVLHDNRYVVAVANWDSRHIDFYRSTETDPMDRNCRFESMARWSATGAERSDWEPDGRSGSCQAINLLQQTEGPLMLVGFHLTAGGQDVADLFSIDLSAAPERLLKKTATKRIALSEGNHFKYGGGLFLQRDELWLLSTERSLRESVRINIAR